MDLEQLFKKCGFSKRYQGYKAFLACVQITLENEEALLYLTGVYANAGKKCRASWKRVERNIRTMLDYSWRTGGREQLEQLSGGVFYKKPSVGEVLEIITCYLKEHPEIR